MRLLICNFEIIHKSEKINLINVLLKWFNYKNKNVMIKFTKWIDEIYRNDMIMWYSKQTQNKYIL